MPQLRFYYGWVVVAVLVTVSFSAAATAGFTFGLFILPMGTELGLSRTALGWTQTVRIGATGVASIVLGPLIDRYGTRVLIPFGGSVTAVALLILGSADTYWVILILFAVIGLFELHIPGNLLTTVPIGKWFIRNRGKAAAIAALGIAAGGMTFSLTHQALIESIGWRDTLRLSAMIVFLGTVPLPLLFLRRTPEDTGLHPDGSVVPYATGKHQEIEIQWTVSEAAHTGTMWKLVAAYTLTNFASGGFMVHRAAYWQEEGVVASSVANVFAMDAITFAVASLATGLLIKRIQARWLAAYGMVSMAGAVTLALFSVSTPALIASPFLFGSGAGINAVVQTVVWADYFGRNALGAIRSVSMPIILSGFAIGPAVLGTMYDIADASYIPGFWIATTVLLASATIMAMASKPRSITKRSA